MNELVKLKPILLHARGVDSKSADVRKVNSTTVMMENIPNVNRAFSRMPRIFNPAIIYTTANIIKNFICGLIVRNVKPFSTALTVEIHAVRM